jgi:predicted ATPase
MSAGTAAAVRGRDDELAGVGELIDRLRGGTGGVVAIEGVPGMGKSRLVSEAADQARRLSVRVGIGSAEPSESMPELVPLLRALFEGSDPLLDRAGLDRFQATPEQRYWLLQDLQNLLERAAARAPILICLDDLQ